MSSSTEKSRASAGGSSRAAAYTPSGAASAATTRSRRSVEYASSPSASESSPVSTSLQAASPARPAVVTAPASASSAASFQTRSNPSRDEDPELDIDDSGASGDAPAEDNSDERDSAIAAAFDDVELNESHDESEPPEDGPATGRRPSSSSNNNNNNMQPGRSSKPPASSASSATSRRVSTDDSNSPVASPPVIRTVSSRTSFSTPSGSAATQQQQQQQQPRPSSRAAPPPGEQPVYYDSGFGKTESMSPTGTAAGTAAALGGIGGGGGGVGASSMSVVPKTIILPSLRIAPLPDVEDPALFMQFTYKSKGSLLPVSVGVLMFVFGLISLVGQSHVGSAVLISLGLALALVGLFFWWFVVWTDEISLTETRFFRQQYRDIFGGKSRLGHIVRQYNMEDACGAELSTAGPRWMHTLGIVLLLIGSVVILAYSAQYNSSSTGSGNDATIGAGIALVIVGFCMMAIYQVLLMMKPTHVRLSFKHGIASDEFGFLSNKQTEEWIRLPMEEALKLVEAIGIVRLRARSHSTAAIAIATA